MTLTQLIESVKDGQRPDPDELRYALLALDAMCTFNSMDMLAMYEGAQVKPLVEKSFDRMGCWNQLPAKEIVGWLNDPDNPDYQESRRLAQSIVKGNLH